MRKKTIKIPEKKLDEWINEKEAPIETIEQIRFTMDIPQPIHYAFKLAAFHKRRSMRDILIEFMMRYTT